MIYIYPLEKNRIPNSPYKQLHQQTLNTKKQQQKQNNNKKKFAFKNHEGRWHNSHYKYYKYNKTQ